MAEANAAYGAGDRMAARMGAAANIDFIGGELASQAYHAGDWAAALAGVEGRHVENRYTNALVSAVRGRISLARGDVPGALADAVATLAFADDIANDEPLFTGLALQAPALLAAGRDGDARAACARFVDRWREIGGITGRSIDLCELAPVLIVCGRGADVRATATILPAACRWRGPLLALAEGREADAADAYAEIGSRPLEATSRLLAAAAARARGDGGEAARHSAAVVEFASAVGAMAWLRQAEAAIANGSARLAGPPG